MKNIKSQVKLSVLVLALISLSACNATAKGGYYYNGKSYDYEYTPSAGAESMMGSDVEDYSEQSRPTIRPGQLTCSAVNDNNKYDYWLKLNGFQDQDKNAEFAKYRGRLSQ